MMMAGTGMSVGGVGMLRTRRRDVSVKPNRKLDRKSSRGMIYENEELRLRTIHINAEVEQGQNDIKKLRKENEQLRREIWSLRDEYEKLEEILKKQKNHEESDDNEDRSEEDEALHSSYSCGEDEENEEEEEEEDEEEEEEEEEDDAKSSKDVPDGKEHLDNAENQKISSEKISTGVANTHRLHVDFDDLSVVDEEEELRKDKDKRDAITLENGQQRAMDKLDDPHKILGPRRLQDNFPFYPGFYDTSSSYPASSNFYSECPFQFPSPRLYDTCLPVGLDGGSNHAYPLGDGQIPPPVIHMPPIGWQNESSPKTEQTTSDPRNLSENSRRAVDSPSYDIPIGEASSNRQRNDAIRADGNPFREVPVQFQAAEDETVVRDDWARMANGTIPGDRASTEVVSGNAERPKHFFAPLPMKLKYGRLDENSPSDTSQFDTSSGTDRTVSTVISRRMDSRKGSMDLYVNGGVSCDAAFRDDPRTFLSTGNLTVEDARELNQLVKSMSCQDLISESQNAVADEQIRINRDESKQQMLTKSDNTLDSIPGVTPGKPYKSQINVTLRIPGAGQQMSPGTPEIPQLPSNNYRTLNNPFLRKLDRVYRSGLRNVNDPLTVRVNETSLGSPPPNKSSSRVFKQDNSCRVPIHGQVESNRLLMAADRATNDSGLANDRQELQVTSFERPSPQTYVAPAAYDLETLRKMAASRYYSNQGLYQNVPFVPRTPLCCQQHRMRLYCDNSTTVVKVPAQTQTSIDGDSHREEDNTSVPDTPTNQRRKKNVKKETNEQRAVSPSKRLTKQVSVTSSEGAASTGKSGKRTSRKGRSAKAVVSEPTEDKNESRSSSSGQDSPKKDRGRRSSVYFNPKKRSSVTSVKTNASGGSDNSKYQRDQFDGTNSERERTNSTSSREAPSKNRKSSTGSGSVPWCACWGNGCV